MERIWIAALVVAVLIAAADTTDTSSERDSFTESRRLCDVELCLTSECVHTASRVLGSMDRKVDPCESFYSFACGEFMRTSKIPEDATTVDSFFMLNDEIFEQLRMILEEPISDADKRPVRLAKDLYTACLNTPLIEERGLAPIQNILKELGGWPVLEGEAWNETGFDWKNTIYKLRNFGLRFSYLIDLAVSPDAKNTTWHMLSLDQASLGFYRDHLLQGLQDKRVSAYHQYQKDIAVILGADPETASKDMLEALAFETALANISMPLEKRRNSSLLYNPMTITDLQANYPSVPWLEYINNLMPEVAQVNVSHAVNVIDLGFFAGLGNLLAATDKRVQANYLLWRVLKSTADVNPRVIADAYLKYKTVMSGILAEPPRWRTCSEKTYDKLLVAVSAMYVKRFFHKEAKQAVLEMVNDIQDSFREMVKEVDWMDENTKERAIAKAKHIPAYVAYPDELLDDANVDVYYKNLQIDRELFLESMMNVAKLKTDVYFSKLHTAVNKSDWRDHCVAADVNAYYDPSENSIEFPAGILQGVFFSPNRPMYMNFGAIGSIMGHEITHGFDDEGRQFDKHGNLVDWWEPETEATFLEKAQCIIDQYGNFTEPTTGLKINGFTTQGENIADNGGVKEAYLGYLRWSQRQSRPEPRLPGLEWLTPRQMFWVSAAQEWCSKTRPESIQEDITTGTHPPKQFRVDGPFSNAEQFSRDFGCPVGSKMNPEHKCKVW